MMLLKSGGQDGKAMQCLCQKKVSQTVIKATDAFPRSMQQ